jgi:hypothetical protein
MRVTAFLLHMICAAAAAGADSDDPVTKQRAIPVHIIGGATYLSAVDAPGRVLSFTPQLMAGSATLQTWLTAMTANPGTSISIPAPS